MFKRIMVFVVVFMCYLSGNALAALAMETRRVSVLSFEGNADAEYRQLAANKLVSVLMNDFSLFEVIERGEINQILNEQHFQATGLVDETKAVEIGRLLAVDVGFIGYIDVLSYHSPWAEARIIIKIIDISSGKLLHIIEGYGTDQNTGGRIAMRKAVEDCFSEHFVSTLRRRIVPYSIVSAVEGDFLYFRNGRDIGIRKGMQYRVLRPRLLNEEDIYKTEIGTAEVTDVSGDISQARIVRCVEKIREGDYLEEIPPKAKQPLAIEKVATSPVKTRTVRPSEIQVKASAPVRTKKRWGVNTYSYAPVLLDENTPLSLVEIRPRQEAEYFYYGTVVGLGYGEEQLYVDAGLELGIHLPVVPQFFVLTFAGTGGYSYYHQGPYQEFFEFQPNNSCHGFYSSFSAGVRFYLFGFDGLRLEYDFFTHDGPDTLSMQSHRFSVGIPF